MQPQHMHNWQLHQLGHVPLPLRRDLNALDVKLYERALELLEHNRRQLSDSAALQALPVLHINDSSAAGDDDDDGQEDDGEDGTYDTYGFLDEYYEDDLLDSDLHL